MKYQHQAAPGAPVVEMNDRPIRIAGVKYTPRWAWSDWYRAEFRNAYSANPKSRQTALWHEPRE